LRSTQDPEADAGEIAEALRKILDLPPHIRPFSANYAQTHSEWSQRARSLSLHATLIGSVGLWVALVGLVNMLFASFHARTREIGLLRTLGATRSSILWSGVGEAVAMAVTGSLLGLGVAGAAALLLSRAAQLPIAVPPVWAAAVLACTAAASCVAALLPASQAASADPALALRQE
jgi:putative ABC transport system permease protein